MIKKTIHRFMLGALIAAPAISYAQNTNTPDIYGSVIFGVGWEHMDNPPYGMYSIRNGEGLKPQTEILDNKFMINGGGTYADGLYYTVNFTEYDNGYEVFYRVYDVENGWKLEYEKPLSSSASIATDMTYNPADDKIYGCFWNTTAGQSSFFLGTLDELTGKSRRIAPLKEKLMTISANREGDLYGVGEFGMFYKINPKTAELTEIGSTGKTIRYDQSATFDYSTGKLYWVMTPDDFMSEVELCEINTTNGNVRTISRVPDRYEFTGLFTKQPFTLPEAAGRVSDVTFDYPQGAADGNIVFTLPSTTFSGTPYSGSMEYTVSVDGETVEQASQTAGSKIRVAKPLAMGMHVVKIAAKNNVGRGPVFTDWIWAGVDKPRVADPTFTVSGTTAEISWKAPEKGINGGYINPDFLSYKVQRMPGKKTVYEGKETHCTDNLAGLQLDYYWYEITALHNSQLGETVATDKQLTGEAISCPYRERFTTENDFNKYTVADANNDGCSWHWEDGMAAYDWNEDGVDADDWLITPPIKLQKNRVYKLTYEVTTVPNYVETVGVSMGSIPSAEGMKEEILPPTQFSDNSHPATEHFVIAKEDRIAHFGFHALSKVKEAAFLYIDNVNVEDVAHADAPQKASFTVKAGEKGTRTATINYTLPTKTISNKTLNTIESLLVYRDNQLLDEVKGVQPGHTDTFTDNSPIRGKHTYKLVVVNEKGEGLAAEQKVYIGEDAPGSVENIRLKDLGRGSVQLTWDAPSVGMNGGYVNPDNLSYVVYNIGRKSDASKTVQTTTLTDKLSMTDDLQKLAWYQIEAKNTFGTGVRTETDTIFLGSPYPLPFKESFARRAFQQGPWILGTAKKAKWDIMQFGTYTSPQDMDDGLAAFIVTTGPKDAATLVSPKITIQGAKNPILSFWVWHCAKADNQLAVVITDAEGNRQLLQTIDQKDTDVEDEKGEWKHYQYSLIELNATDFVQLRFECKNITAEYNTVNVLYVDNISISDVPAYDIAALELQSDKTDAEVGSTINFNGVVQNLGYEDIAQYTAKLKRDNKVIATSRLSNLPAGKKDLVTFKDIPNADAAKVSRYTMILELENDEHPENNESGVCTVAILPGKPYVDDLTAMLHNDKVKLTWSRPEGTDASQAEETTESFEDYEAFRIKGIGEWTMIDADGRNTAGIQDGTGNFIEYPNVGNPMAFQVFNPSMAGLSGSEWSCHDGKQVLAAFTCQYTPNDDWLISPVLSGKQTISFWAKSAASNWYGTNESIEIYYSTSGKELTDFKKIENTITVPSSWTSYTADLPEGVTHFAIRCISNNQFVLFIDDITYTPKQRDFELLGYNVYRNDEQINTELLTETTFTDPKTPASQTDMYHVTVVYNIGESVPSNVVSLKSVDIRHTETTEPIVCPVEGGLSIQQTGNALVNIYSLEGSLLNSFQGNALVHLPAGYYLIRIGQKSIKALVR